MGASASVPAPAPAPAAGAGSAGGGCPVPHGGGSPSGAVAGGGSGVCPVPHGSPSSPPPPARPSEARGTAYNVYAQPLPPPALDARNKMPAAAAQSRAPGQEKELSTQRQASSIRKGGTEAGTTWLYPSPQMFWNALVRKRKAEHVDEDDMPVVVKIHNEMNERTWKMLLGWEAAHAACVSRARARASMPRYA